MNLGTAVVTSPALALVEVAGGASVVAADDELGTALREVVEDQQLRTRLVAAGQERAQAFTWDGAADALWTTYSEIAGRRA
jgi:glycosyltransferase involved in cell wall biosynthesis